MTLARLSLKITERSNITTKVVFITYMRYFVIYLGGFNTFKFIRLDNLIPELRLPRFESLQLTESCVKDSQEVSNGVEGPDVSLPVVEASSGSLERS